MEPYLEEALIRDFSSVDNLKAEFLANAKSMYGPGFVWLVYTRKAYEAGADFFIPKPFDSETLLAKIKTLESSSFENHS